MNALAQGGPGPVPAQQPVLQLLRDLVHERTAVYFENDRLDLMLDKLRDRLAAINCRSYLDYYYLLKYDEQGAAEWRRVMDAFSVQETYFWREFDQVRALVDHVVPAWFKRNSTPLHLWSAACATGEEPFSIVMALNEAGWGSHPIEIHAIDASEVALTRARTGVYRERSFRALPAHLRSRYFESHADGLAIRPEIAAKVHFSWANLAEPASYAALPSPAVIFCRNVFIYFSGQSITRVVSAFAERLSPSGPLFIGSSESLLKLTNRFELQEMGGAFVYTRSAQP
jgi:chemotaxis protein methyltransferase CheR